MSEAKLVTFWRRFKHLIFTNRLQTTMSSLLCSEVWCRQETSEVETSGPDCKHPCVCAECQEAAQLFPRPYSRH